MGRFITHPGPWLVAIVAVGLCFFILSAEREAMDNEAATWRSEQDSLRAELDAKDIRIAGLMAYTDSLKAYTDSAVMSYPPAPVVKERAWKFFEFAPLQQATDTLDTE